MKYLILSMLFVFGIAITGAGNYEPVKSDVATEQVSVEKTLTVADYQMMINEVPVGEPITFFIPPHLAGKLYGYCCVPPGTDCKNYCCYRC